MAIAALVATWVLLQRTGPKKALSAASPAERLNAVYGAVAPNAADIYTDLLARLPHYELQRVADMTSSPYGPLSPAVAAWVDDHEDIAELGRFAADCEGCYFKLQDAGGGFFRAAAMSEWRGLGTYYTCRARRAAETRDLARFAESLQLLDRLGRHARQQPSAIAQIFHDHFRMEAQRMLLEPLTWEGLREKEREWYLAAAEPLCGELPLSVRPFREEAELTAWSLQNNLWFAKRLLVSSARLNGELQKHYDPLEALLEQPVEQRVTVGNPRRMALAPRARGPSALRYVFNLPGVIADYASFSVDGFVMSDAKLVTMLRGNRAALLIHGHKLRTGAWPKSLKDLDHPAALDPFAARPFRYRCNGADFVLYGVGENGADDGGEQTITQRRNKRIWDGSWGDILFWPPVQDCECDE